MNDAELRDYIEDCIAAIRQAANNAVVYIFSRNLDAVKACALSITDNSVMIMDAIDAVNVTESKRLAAQAISDAEIAEASHGK
jgi:hypothetical protein